MKERREKQYLWEKVTTDEEATKEASRIRSTLWGRPRRFVLLVGGLPVSEPVMPIEAYERYCASLQRCRWQDTTIQLRCV